MSYEKSDSLLDLALEMRASRCGLSLADIMDRFGVNERKARRMREAVIRNFDIVESKDEDGTRRVRIPAGTQLDGLISMSADELSALEVATRLLERDNLPSEASHVARVATKVKAFLKPKEARRIEPDVAALLEAEGLAMRPGPRPLVEPEVLDTIRHALKASRKIVLTYRRRRTNEVRDRLVHPYGFLHGHRHYLVAWHEEASTIALFSMANIMGASLTEEVFERAPNFKLPEFAQRSFGVFQEEPFDVAWLFKPDAAEDARSFQFHPTQETELQPDGSLLVTFRAGGLIEMAWHLYCWGDKVEVLAPKELADMVNGRRVTWNAVP